MSMDGSGLSVADALALQDRGNDGMFGGNGSWVFFLFFLLAWGGNGFGWGNRGGFEGALNRADLCQEFNFNDVERGIRGIQQGLCDGFYAQNTTMLQGFNGVQRDMCQGFNAVSAGINQARFDNQQCCCETNRNIDAVRYENARNTCDIINASNANTQRIIDHLTANEMQTLRDNLQTANFQLSQQAQSANLIATLRPTPIPSYITYSPYEAAEVGRFGFGRFGFDRGCGFERGCGCC